ncbi:MAG: FAD-dependent oxidoreductase [Deltaproteobacteria bacterium]|nr:FAD-dependent oxidoreductase [Deltaproteobacteria bacterium]
MLTHLLSPLRIGSLELRNRIAMAPMGVEIVDDDGHAREPLIAYYEERARGGVGLIISEVCAVAYPRGANAARQLGLSDDAFLPGLQELTRRVQSHGARIAAQLVHHGKVSRLDTKEGREVLVPSEPPFHGAMDLMNDLTPEEIRLLIGASGGVQPKLRPATPEDIAQVVDWFAEATLRARRAGFDAVEIHGAHGYLLSGFLSRAYNQRDDEYGGSLENRARLLCEVLRAAKERAGADFPIWCRLDSIELRTPNGITLEDAQRTAELAVEAGADAIHVSAYQDTTSGAGFTEGTLVHKEAGHAERAAQIKARVSVPVIAVGRIEPEVGDRLIREGKADVIAMGRKMLADAAIARKLAEGREDEIRPCVYCYTCVAQPFFDLRVRCAVNPVTANEEELAELERSLAPESRRVLIAGGGPAGLEAARVAALRGHRVTLFEKADQLGGTLRFAAVVYEPNERLLSWQERQVKQLGVELRLGEELTPALAREQGADVVIVATGARRERPDIPGIEGDHVFDGDDLRALLTGADAGDAAKKLSLVGRVAVRAGRAIGATRDPARLRELSRRYMPVGKRVVVVGGGLVGIELAEFLAERGRVVTVLEEGALFATEMAHPRRWRVLCDLREAGVELVSGARVVAIGEESLHYALSGAGGTADEECEVPVDTVVLATGLVANPALVDALRAEGIEPVVIGDCSGVGYIEGAIRDGFQAAVSVDEVAG